MTTPTEPPDMADADAATSSGTPDENAAATESTPAAAEPDDATPGDRTPDSATPETATPETAEPVKSTLATPGGTVPAWWTWVGRHRRPVVLVVGLVVVGLVATLVAVSVFTPGPKDVVQDYLDAIHSGDTKAALAIAGEPDDDGRVAFLSGEALADDWSFDTVVERHRRDDEVDVDVTIRAGKTSRQGRFHLVHGDEGWTMEEPFVRVDLLSGDLGVVELGGVRQPAKRDQATGTTRLLVFPGVYDLYPGLAKRIAFDPAVLIATPQASEEATLRFDAGYTLTEAGADAAQEVVDAHVDDCATKTGIGPVGCPFNAEEDSVVRRLSDVSGVAWTIVTRPEAHFVTTNQGGLDLVVRKPGTVRVTGSGVPIGTEGAARTTFALTCEFGLDNLTIDVTEDGFTVAGVTGDQYAAALSTTCF